MCVMSDKRQKIDTWGVVPDEGSQGPLLYNVNPSQCPERARLYNTLTSSSWMELTIASFPGRMVLGIRLG